MSAVRGAPLALLLLAACASGPPAARLRAALDGAGRGEGQAMLGELIRFKTVRGEESAKDGPGFIAMRQWLERFSRDNGFLFRSVGDNDVFEVSWGEGEVPLLAFVVHGDVVPAPVHEWSVPPFQPTVKDGCIYGRGSEDDKGGLVAALLAMKHAKKSGVEPSGRIVTIVGMGEEFDWDAMKAYATKEKPARYTISVDAAFPLVVGEFGFVEWKLALMRTPDRPGPRARAVDVRGGEFLTQVPGEARLVLAPGSEEPVDALLARARALISGAKLSVEASVEHGQVVLVSHGEAVHSSLADRGKNALWDLARLADQLALEPSAITAMLHVIVAGFAGDHDGERLGLAYADPVMGKLLVTADVLRVEDTAVTLDVNMRRPRGRTKEEFRQRLKEAVARLARVAPGLSEAKEPSIGEPALAALDGPLVATLLDIYRREMHAPDAQAMTIRGGTYARLFPGAVNFGPSLPGDATRAHGPDECLKEETLRKTSLMLGEALVRLSGK